MRLSATVALSLLALAACGGSDDQKRPASTNPARSAKDVSRSPQETLAAVQDAVRGAESFHIEGTQTDDEGITRLEADVAADGAVRLALRQKGAVVDMIVLDQELVYIRADEAFWAQSSASADVQQLLTGRWVKVPGNKDAAELAQQVQPVVVADCLGESVGTLSSRQDSLDGKAVLVLVDAGDKPGTAPGELFVEADDPALPLRVTQTGARRAGGPPVDPKCGSDEDETPQDRSDLRLSRWDEPVEIEAPADALDLEEIAGQGEREPSV
ncbi:MAG: hypothetical protein ABIO51_06335 [Solirubrobacteraceae bacterium]